MASKFNPEVLKGELTLKVAIEESIKLWSFLSEDGNRTKEDYFDIEDADEILNAGCFLCEFVKRISPVESNMKVACTVYNCPLKEIHLCGFAAGGSSFSRWFDNTNKKEREQAAREILKALKKALKKLKETDEKDEV